MLFKESLFPFLAATASAAIVPSQPIRDIIPRAPVSERIPLHHGMDIFKKLTPSKQINWTPCLQRYQCAMLDVPLNYHDKTVGAPRAYVPLMKYAATDLKNYKGMVLLNPGGPGGSGITYLNDFGLEFSNASDTIGQIGPNYDLIAFEPRGVGFSIPSANCTNNTSPSAGGVGKRFDQPNGPFLDLASAGGDIGDQLAKVKGEQCQKMIGGPAGAGQHMSTATVARDMVSITDAFAATPDGVKVKNPKLTNYHGTSYGTFLGQTFASMFPERVGRFVLQGVVDPDDQVSGISLTGLQSTDEAFATFFVYCSLAGPKACPYAIGSTPGDIFLRFERTLARLDLVQAKAKGWANATMIASVLKSTKAVIMQALYAPRDKLSIVATGLVAVESLVSNLTQENVTALEETINGKPGAPSQQDDWFAGNTCSDQNNIMRNVTVKELWPITSVLQHTSYIGADSMVANLITCLGWTIYPKETYQGPFGGPTENPILFVANSWDPVTPIYSAFKGANIFTKAEVLTQNEPGHGVTNKCSVKKIRAYMEEGTMPGNDHFCAGTESGSGPFDTTLTMRMEENGAWRSVVQRMNHLRLKSWHALA